MHGVQLFRMLKDNPDKQTTVVGENFLDDLVNLSRNAIIPNDDETKMSLYSQQPELIDFYIELLGCQSDSIKYILLDLIGDLFVTSDKMCSDTVKKPGFLRNL